MLSALRHVAFGDSQVRADKWETISGQELGALTVGVVGFGRIGQAVASKLSGFGSGLLAFDPYASNQAFKNGVTQVTTLEELLRQSDVITLHAPGSEVLLSAETLKIVKPGVIIINTARAGLVDEHALATALRERSVGSYAADVLSVENSKQVSPLLAEDLKRFVTLTPHIGAQTIQAIDKMGSMSWANVKAVLAGEPPINPVELEQ
jgi:D-3-phosphoglycerate dehydrogenase